MRIVNRKQLKRLPLLVLIVYLLSIYGCDMVAIIVEEEESSATPRSQEPIPSNDPILLSLNDVNGDGIQDMAVIAEDSITGKLTISVKDVLGNPINTLPIDGGCKTLTVEQLPDFNGDLRMELAIFCQRQSTGESKVEIYDPLNGGLIRDIVLNSDSHLLMTSVIGDINGDSYPELAALFRTPAPSNRLYAQIRDPISRSTINNVDFDEQLAPIDILSIPDINRSGNPELVLLAETGKGEFRTIIRDTKSNVFIGSKSLGKRYTAKQLAVAPQRKGSLIEEIAVLQEKDFPSVLVYRAHDGERSNLLNFNPSFELHKLLLLDDFNNNGALELAVMVTDLESGTVKSEIRDALTGNLLNDVFWPSSYLPHDTVTVDDINSNGSEELAFLGERESDGSLAVLLKDAMTGSLLGTVPF